MILTAKQIEDDRRAWLEARRFRDGVGYCLGSSEVPAILGVAHAGNPVKLWHVKVNKLEQPDNPNMFWGRMDEETTARYWRDRNRCVTQKIGLISRADAPWHQTTLDKRVVECPLPEGGRNVCGLEVKHRGPYSHRRWHVELPDDVLAQMCHQIYVTGFDHMHYAVRIGGNEYRQGVVRAEEEHDTINYIVRQVNEYRAAYLAGYGREVQPEWPIDEHAASLIELDAMLHPERDGIKEIEETALVTEFATARAKYNAAKKAVDRAKAALLQLADGAEFVTTPTDNGSQLVFHFQKGGRDSVDSSILREKYPTAAADPEVFRSSTFWTLKVAKPYQVKIDPEEK